MRAMFCGVLIVGCVVGCEIKKKDEAPNVQTGPEGTLQRVDLSPSPVHGLGYAKLWDPLDREKPDPVENGKKYLALVSFSKNPTSYLAPTVVGSVANVPNGGLNAVAMSAGLCEAVPAIAKQLEASPKNLIMSFATASGPSLDASTSGINKVATRLRILSVKNGADDDLRVRFGEYLSRLEEAVKRTDVKFLSHQRGGPRATGSMSEIRYEFGTEKTGFVKSVVVRSYDAKDGEFSGHFLDEDARELFSTSMLSPQKGPYLVVLVKEQKR